MYKITVPETPKSKALAMTMVTMIKPIKVTCAAGKIVIETPSQSTWRVICASMEDVSCESELLPSR